MRESCIGHSPRRCSPIAIAAVISAIAPPRTATSWCGQPMVSQATLRTLMSTSHIAPIASTTGRMPAVPGAVIALWRL
ncbi:hypothetical protein CA257_14535 [Sphingomonas koreensis]|uniref:Uncharacterized protein n=1 Tax=Sphingomonas koreensis TaxID=93064 RepID=A0AAJ4S464_9SPHN|nr:hypothetical protein CA257_14535 [Sphingomonas koreensis]